MKKVLTRIYSFKTLTSRYIDASNTWNVTTVMKDRKATELVYARNVYNGPLTQNGGYKNTRCL
jgi:hypothetical protein